MYAARQVPDKGLMLTHGLLAAGGQWPLTGLKPMTEGGFLTIQQRVENPAYRVIFFTGPTLIVRA